MSAGYHHFIIEQGATFGQTLTLKDSSDTLINLTGYTSAEMDLRETPESSSEVITLTTANNRITLGGSAGTVTLAISAADTANLTAGDGVFDLEIVDGSSRVYRILEGTYTIRRNISSTTMHAGQKNFSITFSTGANRLNAGYPLTISSAAPRVE